jgi:hypothetical protein
MTGLHRAAGVAVLLAAAGRTALVAQDIGTEHRGIEGITAARIAHHIEVLADDSLLGRATPSRGLDAAAAYVAAEFRRAGLHPLSGDDLVVRWPLVTTHAVTSGRSCGASEHDGSAPP